MTEINHFKTISEYAKSIGVRVYNPLVLVVDMNHVKPLLHSRNVMDFYCIFLKEKLGCSLIYGRTKYDYTKGSVVCLAPKQMIGVENADDKPYQPCGWSLFFHPDLLKGTPLGREIKTYHFFDYKVNEALHLSEQEDDALTLTFKQIQMEIENHVDNFSKRLITSGIQMLLDQCQRYYERQFCTRETQNEKVVHKFLSLLENYYEDENAMLKGLPTVNYFAEKCFLSPNYFGDLIKKETGRSPKEMITEKILEELKRRLRTSDMTITQISDALGFQYPQHLSAFFKKNTGTTPNKFRNQQND